MSFSHIWRILLLQFTELSCLDELRASVADVLNVANEKYLAHLAHQTQKNTSH